MYFVLANGKLHGATLIRENALELALQVRALGMAVCVIDSLGRVVTDEFQPPCPRKAAQQRLKQHPKPAL